MEIAAKAGVVYQGSTPQPDGKVTTSQEDIQDSGRKATAGGVTGHFRIPKIDNSGD